MKLLRSWSRTTDSLTAYFDPATRTVYDIHDTDGTFDVRAFGVSNGEMSLVQTLSADFATREEALTELDRLAALISGEAAPVGQGWVEGPPPLDGNHYLVRLTGYPEFPFDVVTKRQDVEGTKPYESSCSYYDAEDITHHIPTPIQPPKETDE